MGNDKCGALTYILTVPEIIGRVLLLSKNKKTVLKNLHPGLAIYKTGRSRYWYARVYDYKERRYHVRSTRETSRYFATQAALDIFHRMYVPDKLSAAAKVILFEEYANKLSHQTRERTKGQRGYAYQDQYKILYREHDGLVAYFGKMMISDIKTGMVRDYLTFLDSRRSKPLAPSTKSKQCIVLRQVLQLALEDGVIDVIPAMPKIKQKDQPRVSFADEDFAKLLDVSETVAVSGQGKVRGVPITTEHVDMMRFAVSSFLRPTESELFGIRFADVVIKKDPDHLELTLNGKTGRRVSATLADAVPIFLRQKARYPKADVFDHVFMPDYPNRTTAVNTYRRVFNHLLDAAGVKKDKDGQARSPYSLRHYALQSRLLQSEGKVNIYWLAQNAGTSVDQLERFYLKGLAPSAARVRNIQTTPDQGTVANG